MANNSCDSVLVKDFTYEEENEAMSIAYLDLIDRESFNQDRRTIITNANVIYDGIPMSGEGNYDEFNAKRERYFAEKRYSSNLNRARTVVSQKTSPEAIVAWKECMNNRLVFPVGLRKRMRTVSESLLGGIHPLEY